MDIKRAEYLFWSLANIAGLVGVILVAVKVIGWWLVWVDATVLIPLTWLRFWMLNRS